jgi:hypothetical protein
MYSSALSEKVDLGRSRLLKMHRVAATYGSRACRDGGRDGTAYGGSAQMGAQ